MYIDINMIVDIIIECIRTNKSYSCDLIRNTPEVTIFMSKYIYRSDDRYLYSSSRYELLLLILTSSLCSNPFPLSTASHR